MSLELKLIFVLFLVFIICLLPMVAKKMRVAYPILLVLAGLAVIFCRRYRL